MRKNSLLAGAATTALIGVVAAVAYSQQTGTAADPHAGHAGMPAATVPEVVHPLCRSVPMTAAEHAAMMMPAGDQSASSQAFAAANAQMHMNMNLVFTGNVNLDFVCGMIPHHQGAIAAARIMLQYGMDAELRRMAEDIIAAQQAEIAQLMTWLDRIQALTQQTP